MNEGSITFICRMIKRKVTIADIARALNTNGSTVSRALNNNPRISVDMRERVQKKARELGYTANAIARQLKEGQSRTIGMVVPRVNRHFFSNVIYGAESIAKKKGYHILICQSNDIDQEQSEAIDILREQHVAGILISLASDSHAEKVAASFLEYGIQVVMFDRVFTGSSIDMVVNENRHAAYTATRHLLEQGYRRILHLGGPSNINVYRERLDGYKDALLEYNIPFDETLVFTNVLTLKEGEELTRELLQAQTSFDAICAASDFSALGALKVLESKNIRIPEEVGITGFANEPFTELIHLTSVEQYGEEMGRMAVELLINKIQGEELEVIPKKMVIPSVLIPRKSSLKKDRTVDSMDTVKNQV